MFGNRILITLLLVPCLGTLSFSQNSRNGGDWETLINHHLSSYQLTDDNRFKLAAYTELKGEWSAAQKALILSFGKLGSLTFYDHNCLLRTNNHRIFHLDKRRNSEVQIMAMNRALSDIFDQILLLSNKGADPRLVRFVNDHLARKNIEPFDKIYLRHILIRYGKYIPQYDRIDFHSDWIEDDRESAYLRQRTVLRPLDPVSIRLDRKVLRGYYLKAGGTVYVEDVQRDTRYATGEGYRSNVTAFKVFTKRLFAQSTQYIVANEKRRMARLRPSVPAQMAVTKPSRAKAKLPPQAIAMASSGVSRGAAPTKTRRRVAAKPGVEPLYKKENWIPLLLQTLRSRRLNIGDPDILPYFINHPNFHLIYAQLTEQEKARVDYYRSRM
ncbi:MAG: hypothetical protein AAFR61_18960 [Bacteroidota bacterium]